MGLTNIKHIQTILITGKVGTGKSTKAKTFVENPIILYANDIDFDVGAFPVEQGIIIEDVHYKPDKSAILDIIRKYKGQVVLTSVNQKSVPKEIFAMCKVKRAGLKETDRELIRNLLLFNKPSDTQIVSWLAENMHPNRLLFIDGVVKRRWKQRYFYEMLAYAHDGNVVGRLNMPTRRKYSKVPSLSRRLKVKNPQVLQQLLMDEDFKTWARKKLNNGECRILKMGEKKRRKKTTPIIINQSSLEDFI